jgi:hypothetical protein
MTRKLVTVTALSALVLALSAAEAFARAGGGKAGGITAPFARPGVPLVRPVTPLAARPFLPHRHRGFAGGLWPTGGYYGAPYAEPVTDAAAPLNNDVNINYTYKQDVPWDWVHRYPPAVAPSDRPYVPGCSSEPVTVPGSRGDHTVNVIRCY